MPKKQEFGYFDLSDQEQRDIIKKCIREANEEQLKLIKKFEENSKAKKSKSN